MKQLKAAGSKYRGHEFLQTNHYIWATAIDECIFKYKIHIKVTQILFSYGI